MMRSATDLCKADLHVFSKLFDDGLERGQPLGPTPLLRPHYRPSSLVRVGPSLCSALVRSPRGGRHLDFSLGIGATGSRSSIGEPGSASRPLTPGAIRPVSRYPAD